MSQQWLRWTQSVISSLEPDEENHWCEVQYHPWVEIITLMKWPTCVLICRTCAHYRANVSTLHNLHQHQRCEKAHGHKPRIFTAVEVRVEMKWELWDVVLQLYSAFLLLSLCVKLRGGGGTGVWSSVNTDNLDPITSDDWNIIHL